MYTHTIRLYAFIHSLPNDLLVPLNRTGIASTTTMNATELINQQKLFPIRNYNILLCTYIADEKLIAKFIAVSGLCE